MVQVATHDGASPAAIALVRWSILTVLLGTALAIPWFRRKTRAVWPLPKERLATGLVGFFLFGPSHVLYYFALTKTSTFEGVVLGTTSPIWVALLAFLLLRERIGPKRLAALAVGFLGAWVVSVGFRLPRLSAGHTVGNLWYLLAVVAESSASAINARIVRRSSGVTVLWCEVIGATAMLALVPLLFGSVLPFSLAGCGWPTVGAIAYLVLVAGMFSFSTWYMLVERAPLSLMVVSLLLQPPITALLGWWFLGERLTAPLLIGTALILAALGLGVES